VGVQVQEGQGVQEQEVKSGYWKVVLELWCSSEKSGSGALIWGQKGKPIQSQSCCAAA
jgi:hypothetical protein